MIPRIYLVMAKVRGQVQFVDSIQPLDRARAKRIGSAIERFTPSKN